jgi:hypothetical protein
MATSSERAAHNESLFRSVNERIEETAEGGMEAVCECDRIDCEDRIHLSVAEYEQVRANPRHFVVLPEHHDDAVEVVHRDEGRFLVIRKVGDAGRAAERAEEGR